MKKGIKETKNNNGIGSEKSYLFFFFFKQNMSLPRLLSEGNKDYDDGMESMNISSLLSSVSASPSFGSVKETKSSSFASTVEYSDLNDEIINNNTCHNDSFDWYLPFPNEKFRFIYLN